MTWGDAQRAEALRIANHVRSTRKALRQRLDSLPKTEAAVEIAQLLRDPPSEVLTAPLFDVLNWGRGIGPSMVRLICRDTRTPEAREIRLLTERQRRDVGDELLKRMHAVGPPPA